LDASKVTAALSCEHRILVLGVGNTLLRDEGIGIHVAEALRSRPDLDPDIHILDGGTLGLSLLPDVEDATALIVIDAARINEQPGQMRIFENSEMDQQLGGKKRSVHELAVSDLLAAAALAGHLPEERALIAIQPSSIDWGLEPSAEVHQAIGQACDAVTSLIERWKK
jgi:hydrogenase maturation protease